MFKANPGTRFILLFFQLLRELGDSNAQGVNILTNILR